MSSSFLTSSDGLKAIGLGAALWVAGVGIVRAVPQLFSPQGAYGLSASTIKTILVATAPPMGFPQVMAFDLLGVPASKRVYAAAAGCATALFMDGVSMAMEGGGAYNVGVEEAKTISSWLLVTFGSVLFAALVLDGASGGHQEL